MTINCAATIVKINNRVLEFIQTGWFRLWALVGILWMVGVTWYFIIQMPAKDDVYNNLYKSKTVMVDYLDDRLRKDTNECMDLGVSQQSFEAAKNCSLANNLVTRRQLIEQQRFDADASAKRELPFEMSNIKMQYLQRALLMIMVPMFGVLAVGFGVAWVRKGFVKG